MGRSLTKGTRAAIAVGGVLAVVGIVTLVNLLGGPRSPIEIESDTVAADWNAAVRKLNIEPIYPPQEDIYVGDIYATITEGNPNFLGRSMRLWHLNLSGAIQRAYQDVPVFPTTTPPPEKPGQIWQQETAEQLFAPGTRKSLSLVAFPSFTVRHARKASAATGTGWLGYFGASRESDETEELSFPRAETYGINAVEASAALISFCETEQNKPLCSDTGVRQMLSMVVGRDIWKRAVDKDGKEMNRYAVSVELVLVNQVFMTRSIVRVHATNSTQAQVAKLVAKIKEAEGLARPPVATPSPSAGSAPSEPSAPQQKAAIDDQSKKLNEVQALVNELARSGDFAAVTASAADGASIALNQIYPRPIVIGIRGVRRIPTPNQ